MSKIEFMTKIKYAELVGVPIHTIGNWMQKRWTRGELYVVIGKLTLIHVERVNAWIKDKGELMKEKDLEKKNPASERKSSGRSYTPRRKAIL